MDMDVRFEQSALLGYTNCYISSMVGYRRISFGSPEDHVAINEATVAVQQAQKEDPKMGLFANFNGSVVVGMFYGTTQTSHRRCLSRSSPQKPGG
ncbi:6-hydroxy-D-nicotine oxidase [Aspergillus luchuensis]|uniref:6-hydroxy-D-nicotine oxidase n=1 Tax=Aspergillus kawachii TaxID=1069201 RepID=A0A146FEC4_ASPKA|nr:6-hydroxy-D-nicotine oxidase [Aspergillus luchuensis]